MRLVTAQALSPALSSGRADDIATPPSSSSLFSEPNVLAFAARIGAGLAAAFAGPIRFGGKIIVARYSDAKEVLARDLDFRIAPINGARIDAVNGPFVLGLDRGVKLIREREALYAALARVDLGPIQAAIADDAAARVAAAKSEIDVVDGYARRIAAHTAQMLFGIKGPDEQTFVDVARAVFGHIFLNLSGDKAVEARALRASKLMRDWFVVEIAQRRASGALGDDMMGALLHAHTDDDLVRRTLGGMLVGSIDTTATSVAKIVAMIGRDKALAAAFAADVDDASRLAGWCWEALRRWPHNPIVLRQAAGDTTLGTLPIAAGEQVIVWTQAAMLDPSAFPDPQKLRPDRPASAYLHFGAGLHPCAGRVVNGFQIPLLVAALLRRGIKSVGPIKWAGPFPDHLIVRFER